MTDPRERKVIHVGTVGDSLSDGASARPSARQRLLARELGGEPVADDAESDDDMPDDGALLAARMRDDDEDAELDAVDDEPVDDDEPDDDEPDDDEPVDGDEPDDDDEPLHDDGVQLRERKTHAPARRGRSPLLGPAPMLLLGATMLWGGAMALRCRPGADLPPAALPETLEPAPESADAAPELGDDAAPIPMGDRTRVQPDERSDAPSEGPDASVPEPRDDWPEGLEIPDSIRYTIRRGGSLENVANLFKIYHHEILAMNPGVGLEQNLAPNTRVVVYQRDPEVASESIGFPSGGTLAGAMPMVEGKGRRILAIPWKTWGTTSTIALLDRVLDRWAARGPDVQDILVGNISNRTGGRLEPHSTHQSGRDVDLGYPQMLAKGGELTWQEMNERNLDAAETWTLLKMLVETRAVEEVYIDRSLQKLLHEHAVKTGVVPKSSLARWMEYPRPTGAGGTVIKHVAGHSDHLHVRFACAKGQSRCKSR